YPSRALQVQYTLLGLASLYRAMTVNLHLELQPGVHHPKRLLTLPLLGAVFYLVAKLSAMRPDAGQRLLRGLFAACGSGLVTWLICYEAPELSRPVVLVLFGVALSEAARALRYPLLAWHTHFVSVAALFSALTADEIGQRVWRQLALRDLSATAVVAGLY